MNFKEYLQIKNRPSEELAANASEMLQHFFSEFWAAAPEIAAIEWTQYTPYFNDGDPCVFGMSMDTWGSFYTTDGWANRDEEDDWPEGDWRPAGGWVDGKRVLPDDRTGELTEVISDFCENAQTMEDVFEVAFGDGVKITATRNGFEIEDYSHG